MAVDTAQMIRDAECIFPCVPFGMLPAALLALMGQATVVTSKQVAVNGNGVLLLSANRARRYAVIRNTSTANSVFLGPSTVTATGATQGTALPFEDTTFAPNSHARIYVYTQGELYGASAAASTVHVLEFMTPSGGMPADQLVHDAECIIECLTPILIEAAKLAALSQATICTAKQVVIPTANSVQILAANPKRRYAVLKTLSSGTGDVFIGTPTVTASGTTQGFDLPREQAPGTIAFNSRRFIYTTGELWGIASGTGNTVAVLEFSTP